MMLLSANQNIIKNKNNNKSSSLRLSTGSVSKQNIILINSAMSPCINNGCDISIINKYIGVTVCTDLSTESIVGKVYCMWQRGLADVKLDKRPEMTDEP